MNEQIKMNSDKTESKQFERKLKHKGTHIVKVRVKRSMVDSKELPFSGFYSKIFKWLESSMLECSQYIKLKSQENTRVVFYLFVTFHVWAISVLMCKDV